MRIVSGVVQRLRLDLDLLARLQQSNLTLPRHPTRKQRLRINNPTLSLLAPGTQLAQVVRKVVLDVKAELVQRFEVHVRVVKDEVEGFAGGVVGEHALEEGGNFPLVVDKRAAELEELREERMSERSSRKVSMRRTCRLSETYLLFLRCMLSRTTGTGGSATVQRGERDFHNSRMCWSSLCGWISPVSSSFWKSRTVQPNSRRTS